MGFFDFFRRKNGANRQADDSPPAEATRHCFVICKSAHSGDSSLAAEVVDRVLGSDYTTEVDEKNAITVSRGRDAIGYLVPMPTPIPGGEVESCADANFLWPNGKAEASQHRSHVIVFSNRRHGEVTPVESAIAVSRLALVALDVFDGIGVYWGNANVSNSRASFEKFCKNVPADRLPIPVVLRFQPVSASDNQIGLYTLGMHQFGLMDIEVDGSRLGVQDLCEFVWNMADYLIQSGPTIADGHTVGLGAEEPILVRHRPSMIDKQRQVYKIEFGG